MGNAGHVLNCCGITDAAGFGRTAAGVIRLQGIEPWPARELVKQNLARQAELARMSPLREIPVEVGMNWFKENIGGWFKSSRLTRDVFVDRATELLEWSHTRHTQQDRYALYDIFDSMDYDHNGELSVGEWAGGLTVFFKGNVDQCIHAVFDVLDTNGDRSLSKSELQEYLKPFVNAMTPPEADAIRPLLTKKATDDIFEEMDFDHNQMISSDEMLLWSKQGNNIIDRLAKVIDHEVYTIWLEEKERERRRAGRAVPIAGDRDRYPPPPQQRQAWEQQPDRGYGGGYGSAPYGAPPGNYGPAYGAGYGDGYGQSLYGGSYGQSSQTYRGPSQHSFMTDLHHDSAFGGSY